MKITKKIIIAVSILTIGNYFNATKTPSDSYFEEDDQAVTEQLFQPSDGSMKNGTYFTTKNTAKTVLNNYEDVIAIDGTKKTPTLNAQGKYVNSSKTQLNAIGSYGKHSNDSGETSIYYLFGTISKKNSSSNKTDNSPNQTYSSQGN